MPCTALAVLILPPLPALPCTAMAVLILPPLPCPALPCLAHPGCPNPAPLALSCPALPCTALAVLILPPLPCPALPCTALAVLVLPPLPCPCPALAVLILPPLPCPALPCPVWLHYAVLYCWVVEGGGLSSPSPSHIIIPGRLAGWQAGPGIPPPPPRPRPSPVPNSPTFTSAIPTLTPRAPLAPADTPRHLQHSGRTLQDCSQALGKANLHASPSSHSNSVTPCRDAFSRSIIFIRDRNAQGQEISGYIDYSHRLKLEDFEPYFSGKKRLLPRSTDLRCPTRVGPASGSGLERFLQWKAFSHPVLCERNTSGCGARHLHEKPPTIAVTTAHRGRRGPRQAKGPSELNEISRDDDPETPSPKLYESHFYNWETQVSTSNDSANYEVIAENSTGLLFKNKRDRKILNVDPKASPGDNSSRTPLQSDLYTQVVIYDHITRRRA
ncbi:hypothetical protein ACEWY4_012369 [Coilia grayii]|uniref:Cilia- and flagella-associated protein 299 n=1 Tax=Coilia grayii TaxID=363190 RepID=A0ABD1K0B7_9TELE